jgi:T5SS/PEP-CTERM-associated repeat protein/autotransporter-associated beta strand protein
MNLRAVWLACTALTVVAGPTASHAADWTGANSTDWFDAANWSTNAVPIAADDVIINTIAPNPTAISGAAVSNVGRIASAVGSTGQVTVGAGSSWTNSSSLIVGDLGTGTLVIQNGGQVTNTSGSIGSDAGSTGQVTVTGAGSTWTNSGFFNVGGNGTGTLLIQNGGQMTSADGRIGFLTGSTGQVTVTGAGSSWMNSSFLEVGFQGAGALAVQNGGQVTSTVGRIGFLTGSTGQATVDGAGSNWTMTSDLRLGIAGTGTLVVQNGGQVTNASGSIGDGADSTGHATVNGAGSRWTNSSGLSVGNLGAGTLVIQNGGRVTNTFGVIGNSGLASGRVTVDGADASWTSTQMRIGNSGTGTLTIRNGGTASATDVFVAVTSTAVGTLNIGAASGAVAEAPGTLSTPIVAFGSGTGQIVFNHTATSYTFAPLISGAGTVRVENGTTNLTANNTYTGNTLVNGGTLLVNGSIAASATTVNPGGTLGGTGTVGETSISGGTLSPGNSVGTLTVQGSLVFTAASTYLVEIDASGVDRTNVTGTATLGGARVAVKVGGGANRRHTILNATGGVAGTFAAATADNFIATLSYDANSVFLDLQAALGRGTPLNQNQQAVATTLNNAFSNGHLLPSGFFTLFNLTGVNLANALSQVSGETATGTQQTTFDAMGQFTSLLLDPSLGERGAGLQGGASNAYASIGIGKAPPLAAPFVQRWNVWAAGYGGTQSTDGNATVGSNDVTSKIFGAAAGFDYRVSPQTLVGFSLGGAGTKYDLANGLGSGRSEMFQAGVYGRHDIGATYLAAALAYGWQDVTTDRNVLLSSLRANFDTNAISGRLEAGHRFVTGPVGLTPYVAGQFTTVFLPDYAEQVVAGANTFSLSYAGKDVTASRSELGLRADRSFAMQDAVVTLRGRAAWAHNFDTDRSIAAVFQTLPVAGFVVNGAAPAHDAALVSASAETRWQNGVSVAASFDGEFSNLTESYAGKGVVRYRW